MPTAVITICSVIFLQKSWKLLLSIRPNMSTIIGICNEIGIGLLKLFILINGYRAFAYVYLLSVMCHVEATAPFGVYM